MTDVPSTDEVRDIWVDWHLNPLPRVEGIALVPEYQRLFDAWLDGVRASERYRADATHMCSVVIERDRDYLRAAVQALPELDHEARVAVLALLDGGSDA